MEEERERVRSSRASQGIKNKIVLTVPTLYAPDEVRHDHVRDQGI